MKETRVKQEKHSVFTAEKRAMTYLFTSFTFEDSSSITHSECTPKLVAASFFCPSSWMTTFDRWTNLFALITFSDSSEAVIIQSELAFISLTEMGYIIPYL